jgi:hypothetical protein
MVNQEHLLLGLLHHLHGFQTLLHVLLLHMLLLLPRQLLPMLLVLTLLHSCAAHPVLLGGRQGSITAALRHMCPQQ